MIRYYLQYIFLLVITSLIFTLSGSAQPNRTIELDIEVSPLFSEAQIIEFVSLALDESGRGARLFSFILQNSSSANRPQIYIEYTISSRRNGLLLETYQSTSSPITLQPGQILIANNNDLASSSLPGISDPVYFNGDITSEGRDLLNQMRGGSRLPTDIYTLKMDIYQRGNSRSGGNLLASESVILGENLIDGDLSIMLISPGDEPGTDISISNPYPEFRWEGTENITYRIVLVEAVDGESGPALIESALSTNPGEEGASTSLLEFEHADILVNRTSLQFPSSGVQPLRHGQTYYWQVFSTLKSTTGEETLSSEIWSFRLNVNSGAGGGQGGPIPVNDELLALLYAILGEEKTDELIRAGFDLDAVQIDDEEYRGDIAGQQLEELLQKVREGTVKFTTTPQ